MFKINRKGKAMAYPAHHGSQAAALLTFRNENLVSFQKYDTLNP
jgi:hypothetical protein